jgi:protein ImuB
MPRVLTIWLPRWPVQRRLIERPGWRKKPVFVCRREARGLMTVASWAWVEPPKRRRAAIQPGMPLAEAMAVLAMAYGSQACHAAEIDPDDQAADVAALEQLARMCRRFAPVVGIEAVPRQTGSRAAGMTAGPECLLLDVTATAGFFGGETALARTAAWTLAARGLHARTAIADTPAAAWAAAHHTNLVAQAEPRHDPAAVTDSAATAFRLQASRGHRRWAIVPPGAQRLARGERAVLADLPLSALQLEQAAIDMLQEVGVDTIGGLLRLPARSLASRFPDSVSRRLAELSGSRPEPIVPPGGEALPQASHDFDLPLSLASVDEARLADLVEGLVEQCTASLAARGEGIVSLQMRLEPAVTGMAAPARRAAPTVIDVGLFRPSVSAKHLVDLLRLRMSRAALPREIEAIAIEVVASGPVECRQRPLFDLAQPDAGRAATASQAAEVGLLLDRLAGRLGRPAVFEPRPVADAQPEHAWIAASPGPAPAPPTTASRSGQKSPRASRQRPVSTTAGRRPIPAAAGRRPIPAAAGRRPIWMPPRPVPLEPLQAGMLSVAPDGPPVRFRLGDVVHRVRQAHGPERIETAWWRGPTVRRDYYVVETESGARFWLFRRLGRLPRGSRGSTWYLHGVFA